METVEEEDEHEEMQTCGKIRVSHVGTSLIMIITGKILKYSCILLSLVLFSPGSKVCPFSLLFTTEPVDTYTPSWMELGLYSSFHSVAGFLS